MEVIHGKKIPTNSGLGFMLVTTLLSLSVSRHRFRLHGGGNTSFAIPNYFQVSVGLLAKKTVLQWEWQSRVFSAGKH